MIRARSGIDGPPLIFTATVSGLAIYLDNFALISLAKGDPLRRKRFVDAVRTGSDLLFSVTNAAELTGPQGRSLEAVRTFLDQVGRHWFPVELDPFEVANRELKGATVAESCVSKDFMKQFFTDRTSGYSPDSGRVIDLSEHFFRLGAVLDWLGPQRESIRKGTATLDAALIKKISEYRAKFERDPLWLDQKFPVLPFNPSKPATFTYVNLVRTMIVDAKAYKLKKGDGLDFCHAVMASAFASVATLDKHWKHRVEHLPKPNGLARIYYQPELDKMVTDIEFWLKQGEAPR
ncbi:MAG: hypothetical protein V3U60_15965 [Gammaproteobacteria bacterium]